MSNVGDLLLLDKRHEGRRGRLLVRGSIHCIWGNSVVERSQGAHLLRIEIVFELRISVQKLLLQVLNNLLCVHIGSSTSFSHFYGRRTQPRSAYPNQFFVFKIRKQPLILGLGAGLVCALETRCIDVSEINVSVNP